jgi:hypothetical protein
MDRRDLREQFKEHFGIDIANREGLGNLAHIRDEEHALSGFNGFLRQLLPDAPQHHIDRLTDTIHHRINEHTSTFEKYYAMGYALQAGRGAHAPNSIASLLPYLPGGTATPGTSYPLYASLNGVVQVGSPFTFLRQQTFHRLMTSKADADAGWFFSANTVKFQDDPISGMTNDCSFTVFEAEVVFDRTPLGAYSKRRFIGNTTIQFNASAFINPNMTAAGMISGVMIEYRDDRCRAGETILEGAPSGATLPEIVQHLIGERVNAIRGPNMNMQTSHGPYMRPSTPLIDVR